MFFPSEAVGKDLFIGGTRFTVVGVLESEGSSFMGNTDEMVLIPFTTAQRFMQNTEIRSFFAAASDSDSVELAQVSIENYLAPLTDEEDGYFVFNQSEILESLDEVTGILTMMLGGIAAISLLVGRDWDYEYYAGLCHRTDAGNRYSKGNRRYAAGYSNTVFN